MERIHYAGSSFLTGDLIARALIDYAHYLTAHNMSATVDIPIRKADGSEARANFLLVPTSQVVAESELSAFDELVDDDLVATLRDRMIGLPISRPGPIPANPSFDAFSYSDLVEMV